jgi:hypothetical protein
MLNENTRQEFIRRYTKLVSNPDIWLLTARRLFASANLVAAEAKRRWDDMDFRKPRDQTYEIHDEFSASDFQAVYMMLAGFVLENLFKARLIEKNRTSLRESITKSGEMPRILKTHDLRKLAGMCEFKLDQDTENLLDRVTKHSVWRGRYHFPLDFETFYHLTPENDIPSSGIGYTSDDVDRIARTIKSVCDSLGFPNMRQATP